MSEDSENTVFSSCRLHFAESVASLARACPLLFVWPFSDDEAVAR